MSVYDRIYEQLKPQLHELENLRVVARNKRTSAIIYSVIIGIITILLTLAAIGTFHSLFAGFIVGGIGVGVAYLVYLKTAKQHVSLFFHTFKADIVRSIAESLEPSMIYKPYQGISKSYFKSIGHYSQKIDRYSSEDQFSGTIGKTELHFSELHAEYETTSTDSDGDTSTTWHTIFQGVMFAADFHKHFQTWVMIKPDSESGLFGWIGKKMQQWDSKIIRIENPEFEEHFKVTTGNDQQARYILTPDMQERILKLRRSHGQNIIISFQKDHVYITAPNSNDWFETTLGTNALSKKQVTRIIQQIHHFLKIVDTLNLNTRIWTKE